MKKALALALTLGMIVGALAGVPAHAKKAKPKPVKLYLHGTEQLGELDLANNFAVGYNKMDSSKPDGAAPKSTNSFFWTEHWNDCAGMYGVPAWQGQVAGTVVGDLKLTLHTVGGPQPIQVEVWPDVNAMACASNDLQDGSYPEPAAIAEVTVAPGANETEIVLKNKKFKAFSSLLVQVTPMGHPAGPRLLYDGADFASSLEFKCVPAKGSSCTP